MSLRSAPEITKYDVDLGTAITNAYETTRTERRKTRYKHSTRGIQGTVAGMPEYRRLVSLRQNELKRLRARRRARLFLQLREEEKYGWQGDCATCE